MIQAHLLLLSRFFGVIALAIASSPALARPEPLPVREVAPGAFVFEAPIALADSSNRGAIANVGFVIGRDAVAVIDTGGSLAAGQRLLAAIRARTKLPSRYVINTHFHPDHVLGNSAFGEMGAVFVGHRNLPQALGAREEQYLRSNRELVGESFEGTKIVVPTVLVDGTRDLDLGDRVLRLEAWPTSHTNTDLTVLDRASGTWFLGDLLFVRHVPALDGKLTGWIATLHTLEERQVGRVVPGHGPAAIAWPDAAVPIERYLERLESDVRVLIRGGHSLREAAEQAGRSEANSWLLFDEFNARNATAAYHELEWE
jgi:quinoprotein relay system zinc metallohydrolase 2